MTNYIINIINSQRFYKTLLFLFAFSLFFPFRHVFLTNSAHLTGEYSDFTSFSLYLSDILLFITCLLLILPRGKKIWLKLKAFRISNLPTAYYLLPTTLLSFWLILELILHFSSYSLYFIAKWLELIVAYGTTILLARGILKVDNLRNWVSRLFVGFCSIQSILALLQFWSQTSLGVYRLGESHLAPNLQNVAKIVVDGQTYIRGYGSFPHPNLLAVFLLVGILISGYVFLNSTKKSQIWWGISIFLNILGLTVTFSRAAYLGLSLGFLIFFCLVLKIKNDQMKARKIIVIIIVIASSVFSFLLFRHYLITRATIKDNAVSERIQYNNIGLNIVKANPLFGVGLGESVLHMQQYSPDELQPWQKQPIHNYFLLSVAELGIPGALILIWIFVSHLKTIGSNLKASQDFHFTTYNLLLTTVLITFLVLMLFDHYFYTLQQTQLLLWIILGIIADTTRKQKNHPA